MSSTDFAEMSKTAAEHEKLKPFEGTFRAEVKMFMGPGEPMVSTGTMVNRLILGGLFLEQVYTGDPSDGPFRAFEGRGYWGYNKNTGEYEGVWVDNASSVMHVERGSLDGNAWTMSGTMDCGDGKIVNKRSVITLDSANEHRMEMYDGEGRDAQKMMDIHYVRKG